MRRAATYAVRVPPSVVLRRLGYRAAFRCLQLFWLVTRPAKHGVKCVITDRDRVLLVRHTYGSRAWDLPGGGVRRGEAPASAAGREMAEELGLGDAHWIPLGEVRGGVDHRHDIIHVYGARVTAPPLTLNLAELSVAAWFPRDRLPLELGPFAGPILDGVSRYATAREVAPPSPAAPQTARGVA